MAITRNIARRALQNLEDIQRRLTVVTEGFRALAEVGGGTKEEMREAREAITRETYDELLMASNELKDIYIGGN